MTDWFDPTTWEQGAKATAAVLDVLAKLRDALSRRKKATRPEYIRELDKELGLRGFEWVEKGGGECENPLWERLEARLSRGGNVA